MSVDDTKPAPLSAARLAEIREWAQAAKHDTRKRSLQLVLDVEALLAHLDALAPRAPVDGDALGFGVFLGDMRETDNHATREAWAQMEPDPKAEYVSRALALVAIGYAAGAVAMTGEGDDPGTEGAILVLMKRHDEELHEAHAAGRGEGDAERAALAAELAKRDAEIEGLRCELAKRDALTAEARAALTPRAPSTREQRVERLGKIARELLQIGEDTVSEYLARDAEIARLTQRLAGVEEQSRGVVGPAVGSGIPSRGETAECGPGLAAPIYATDIERAKCMFRARLTLQRIERERREASRVYVETADDERAREAQQKESE